MIDTSWSSIRVALIMVMAVVWFYLLNVELRSRDEDECWGLSQPVEKVQPPSGVWTTQVKKPVHPEMVDVEPGEELMGVTFKQEEVDELQESLKARIEELSTDDEDDDDDDGGDVIVRV